MDIDISVKNIGPIAEGNLSLSKINVFVGTNNSGKSILSRCIYACGTLNEKQKGLFPSFIMAGTSDLMELKRLLKTNSVDGCLTINMGKKKLKLVLSKKDKPLLKVMGDNDNGPTITYIPNRTLMWSFAFSSFLLAGTKLFAGPRFDITKSGNKINKPILHDMKNTYFSNFENRKYLELITSALGIDGTIVDAIYYLSQEDKRHPDVREIEYRIIKGRTDHTSFTFFDTLRKISIPLPEASSGSQEIWGIMPLLSRALNESENGKKTILIFDEPEVHLHPPALIEFADWFVEMSEKFKNMQIIISTHSDILLRAMTNAAAGKHLLNDFRVFGFDTSDNGVVSINQKKIYSEGEIEGIKGFSDAINKITGL